MPDRTLNGGDVEAELRREQFKLEIRKIELEEARFKNETRFATRHTATIVTSLISVTAVIVSATQILLADKQNRDALALQSSKTASELAQQVEHDAQEWRLRVASIVFEHAKQIFSSDERERTLGKEVLDATLPPDLKQPLFAVLEDASVQPAAKKTWAGARVKVTKAVHAAKPLASALQQTLARYKMARDDQTTIEEAFSMLRFLGVSRISMSTNGYVSGILDTGYEVTIWRDTYGKPNCYGIRFGLPEPGRPYFGSNETYFEICK